MSKFLISLALVAAAMPQATFAHGGGLAADGCHNDRQRGGRHCHGSGRASAAPQRSLAAVSSRARSGGASYANCAAARAAGAAPVRAGQAGYGPHLDRDGDGVGCE